MLEARQEIRAMFDFNGTLVGPRSPSITIDSPNPVQQAEFEEFQKKIEKIGESLPGISNLSAWEQFKVLVNIWSGFTGEGVPDNIGRQPLVGNARPIDLEKDKIECREREVLELLKQYGVLNTVCSAIPEIYGDRLRTLLTRDGVYDYLDPRCPVFLRPSLVRHNESKLLAHIACWNAGERTIGFEDNLGVIELVQTGIRWFFGQEVLFYWCTSMEKIRRQPPISLPTFLERCRGRDRIVSGIGGMGPQALALFLPTGSFLESAGARVPLG